MHDRGDGEDPDTQSKAREDLGEDDETLEFKWGRKNSHNERDEGGW